MKKYKWSAEKIARWHTKTLPEETTAGQRLKCSLEAKEYFAAESYEQRIEEMADCYIANAALAYRFGDAGGRLLCQMIRDSVIYPWPKVAAAVDAKMDVNVERVFVKVGDEYRHK